MSFTHHHTQTNLSPQQYPSLSLPDPQEQRASTVEMLQKMVAQAAEADGQFYFPLAPERIEAVRAVREYGLVRCWRPRFLMDKASTHASILSKLITMTITLLFQEVLKNLDRMDEGALATINSWVLKVQDDGANQAMVRGVARW